MTPFVRGMSNAQVQRVLETAINQHMPAHAQARREQAADSRHVTINTEQISFAGTAGLFAELDLADALDLDQALTTGAAQLADLGNTETLNIRRSLALGEMSRTQYTLPLHTPSTEPAAPVQRRARVLNLFLHLHPDGTALLENTNTLLTLEQVKTWCTDPDTTLTLRPVIDLAQQITTPTYAPSAQLREQVIQRDLRLPPLHHPRPRLRPRPHHPLRPPRPV